MDTIAINGISCEASFGRASHDVSAPETLIIDVLLSMDLEPAANQDDPALTVDYERVIRKVKKLVADHQFVLLEAVAGHLCRALLAEGPMRSVQVTVRRFPSHLREEIDHIAIDMRRG